MDLNHRLLRRPLGDHRSVLPLSYLRKGLTSRQRGGALACVQRALEPLRSMRYVHGPQNSHHVAGVKAFAFRFLFLRQRLHTSKAGGTSKAQSHCQCSCKKPFAI